MGASRRPGPVVLAALVGTAALLGATMVGAHPLGNFSINHYAALTAERDAVEVRYVIDLAEIPTFQEIRAAGITPEPEGPAAAAYLDRKVRDLGNGLVLELNGRPVALGVRQAELIFPPGAGGLPTMKIGAVYHAAVAANEGIHALRYRDTNYPERAGWKEVVAVAGPGVVLAATTVPTRDRSNQLSDYPTDLLESPPQDVEARLAFVVGTPPVGSPRVGVPRPAATLPAASPAAPPVESAREPAAGRAAPPAPPLALQPNRAAGRRDVLTDLVGSRPGGLGILLATVAVAVALGAFHALEPGHGKTVVAAYLVGSRGTAGHALVLGLTVTAAHTVGVYLLGGVTLYASHYVVPERLYPWLALASGLTIAGLGLSLVRRRLRGGPGQDHPGHHHHHHGHDHPHSTAHPAAFADRVSLRQLLALGVTGGVVPCPAALVVLLSAVSFGRIGLGLILILAFSAGLAVVLVAIGLLVVRAGRLVARWPGDGSLITRWLPATSAAVITALGVGMTVQALVGGGLLPRPL
jgi:ABC-type nickel/cobalt efflux system permease component RcnA